MTPDDAIRLAEAEAQELGLPWAPHSTTATRRHVWPFGATWRVTSNVDVPQAQTTMRVSERQHAAFPVRVLYPATRRGREQASWVRIGRRLVLPALVGGGLAYLVAAFILRWPLWVALLLAGTWALVTPILLASIRAERAVDLTHK